MLISRIRQQKNGRYAIYSEDGYAFSVGGQTLVEFGLAKGAEIPDEKIEEIKENAAVRAADDKAMRILSYRDHSKEELKRKLSRTVGEDMAEKAAEHMENIGLVNDREYAEKFASELLDRRLMGESRALYEMKRRGIDPQIAEEALDSIDSDPQERIIKFLEKKYPGWDEDEKIRKRALSALSRNGYRWYDIKRVMEDYDY